MKCHDIQFGRYIPVLRMNILPPSSEQKKTLKTETAFGIIKTILWQCDKITTFWKLNLLLHFIWLLEVCYMGLVIIRKMQEKLWDKVFKKRKYENV